MNGYDRIRERAKAMGHSAANAPDAVIRKVMESQDRRTNLTRAKLCIEDYMMGDLDPVDFAQAMAGNDALRYAVADLCASRLSPKDMDIQRNDNYVDVGAGLKTFWTEIRVPLPSEAEAMRDMRNISIGVEAGKRTARAQAPVDPINPGPESVKYEGHKTLQERLADAREKSADRRRSRAEKAIERAERTIEKNRPIAEGTDRIDKEELEKAWFDTDKGRRYKTEATRKAAQDLNGAVADIESGMDRTLSAEERKKMADARQSYSQEELDATLDDDMKALMDQIAAHMGQSAGNDREQDEPSPQRRSGRRRRRHEPEHDAAAGQHAAPPEQPLSDIPDDQLFTYEDMAAMEQPPTSADMDALFGDADDYMKQMMEDMADYQPEEPPTLTSADCQFQEDGPGLAK